MVEREKWGYGLDVGWFGIREKLKWSAALYSIESFETAEDAEKKLFYS